MPSAADVQDGIFAIVKEAHPTTQSHDDLRAKLEGRFILTLQRVGVNADAMAKAGRLELRPSWGWQSYPYIKRYGLPSNP